MLVVDVARWRNDDVAGRAMDYLKTYRDRVFFWDQEALNAVLAGKWGELDSRWNWHPTIDHLVGDHPVREGDDRWSKKIRIVHFSGNLKPWTYSGSSPHHKLYFQYLDQTAWSGWRPTRSWKGMLLEAYELSPLRRLLYPAEQWSTTLLRTFTRKYHHNEGK